MRLRRYNSATAHNTGEQDDASCLVLMKEENCSLVGVGTNESPSRQQSLKTPVICRQHFCEPRGKKAKKH
jgi:hypothetical protein